MAVLSKDEARRERAKKHARRRHECSLCGRVTHGNGGSTSHRNAHLRKAKLSKGDWIYLLDHRELYLASERSTT